MTNNITKTRFKIKKAGPRQFYWVVVAPGGQVLARGPQPGKYVQSAALCRERIALVKNNAHNWLIDD